MSISNIVRLKYENVTQRYRIRRLFISNKPTRKYLEFESIKNHSPKENIEKIDEILGSIRSRLYGDTQSNSSNSQLDSSEELEIIKKKLIISNKKDDEKKFDFQIKTISMESVLDDLNKFNYKLVHRKFWDN